MDDKKVVIQYEVKLAQLYTVHVKFTNIDDKNRIKNHSLSALWIFNRATAYITRPVVGKGKNLQQLPQRKTMAQLLLRVHVPQAL